MLAGFSSLAPQQIKASNQRNIRHPRRSVRGTWRRESRGARRPCCPSQRAELCRACVGGVGRFRLRSRGLRGWLEGPHCVENGAQRPQSARPEIGTRGASEVPPATSGAGRVPTFALSSFRATSPHGRDRGPLLTNWRSRGAGRVRLPQVSGRVVEDLLREVHPGREVDAVHRLYMSTEPCVEGLVRRSDSEQRSGEIVGLQ